MINCKTIHCTQMIIILLATNDVMIATFSLETTLLAILLGCPPRITSALCLHQPFQHFTRLIIAYHPCGWSVGTLCACSWCISWRHAWLTACLTGVTSTRLGARRTTVPIGGPHGIIQTFRLNLPFRVLATFAVFCHPTSRDVVATNTVW